MSVFKTLMQYLFALHSIHEICTPPGLNLKCNFLVNLKRETACLVNISFNSLDPFPIYMKFTFI